MVEIDTLLNPPLHEMLEKTWVVQTKLLSFLLK